jgi:hypothetical protein
MEPIRVKGRTKPYCELGKLLDILARSRDVRGPYQIAQHLEYANGYEVSGQAVSKYLYGNIGPKRAFVEAFADAFGLSEQERFELAWTYAYGLPIPPDKKLIALDRSLARG